MDLAILFKKGIARTFDLGQVGKLCTQIVLSLTSEKRQYHPRAQLK
jgi:hypothetical protein